MKSISPNIPDIPLDQEEYMRLFMGGLLLRYKEDAQSQEDLLDMAILQHILAASRAGTFDFDRPKASSLTQDIARVRGVTQRQAQRLVKRALSNPRLKELARHMILKDDSALLSEDVENWAMRATIPAAEHALHGLADRKPREAPASRIPTDPGYFKSVGSTFVTRPPRGRIAADVAQAKGLLAAAAARETRRQAKAAAEAIAAQRARPAAPKGKGWRRRRIAELHPDKLGRDQTPAERAEYSRLTKRKR